MAKNLLLQKGEPKKFIVSVSGGLDSTVLLFILAKLAKSFPISLEAFHMNFQLRGKDSKDDEKFVQNLTSKLKIQLHLFHVKISGENGIQEKAREKRFEALASLSEGELLEAHHADDQVETFLFRLFRGSGLAGLSGMQVKSERGGRQLWRPFLFTTKAELEHYAKEFKIKFRTDASNLTTLYDRNWIRNAVLPRIEKKFPRAREAILRTMTQISDENSGRPLLNLDTVIIPEGWRWEPLKGLDKADLRRWIHEQFYNDKRIFLSRAKIVELADKIREGKPFSFNAPKDLVLRGRQQSRTVSEPKIFFLALKG